MPNETHCKAHFGRFAPRGPYSPGAGTRPPFCLGGQTLQKSRQDGGKRPPERPAPLQRPAAPMLMVVGVSQSLMASDAFQHILRVLNTNVDGKQKIMYAITAIKGISRRFSNLACKKGEVDMKKR